MLQAFLNTLGKSFDRRRLIPAWLKFRNQSKFAHMFILSKVKRPVE